MMGLELSARRWIGGGLFEFVFTAECQESWLEFPSMWSSWMYARGFVSRCSYVRHLVMKLTQKLLRRSLLYSLLFDIFIYNYKRMFYVKNRLTQLKMFHNAIG